jgi:hypothetical protein
MVACKQLIAFAGLRGVDLHEAYERALARPESSPSRTSAFAACTRAVSSAAVSSARRRSAGSASVTRSAPSIRAAAAWKIPRSASSASISSRGSIPRPFASSRARASWSSPSLCETPAGRRGNVTLRRSVTCTRRGRPSL